MIQGERKTILGIDYGRSKIGLALAITTLAEPYKVIRYKKVDESLEKVIQVLQIEQVDQIVIGISEGRMAREIKEFGKKLEQKIDIPISYQDETLSTRDAQYLSIKTGMKKKKRKEMEDAYAAAVFLQHFLDNNL